MTRRFLTPLSTNHVDFNINNPSTWAEGRLWWDDEEGTLELGHVDGVTQSIGMEFFMPPTKNDSGVEIPAGSFVMATGAQGDRITIAKAVTDGSVNPEYMIGVAATTIDNGSETGLITTHGTVRDIDTSDWIVGTILYPSSASPGMFTASAGVAPDIRTPIAIVLRQHENTGRIYVRMTNAHKLGEEQDVKIDNPQNNEVLYYNSSSSLWENASVSSLIGENGVTSLTGTPNEIEVSASVGSVQVGLPDEVRIESLGMGSASVDVNVEVPNFLAISGQYSAISTDSTTWTQGTMPVNDAWWGVDYGNGVYVSVAWTYGEAYPSTNMGGQIAAVSTNGINWTRTTLPAQARWREILFGNGIFVAVNGNFPPGTVGAISTDGVAWTQTTIPNGRWDGSTFANGYFIFTGGNGSTAIIYSTDGVTWSSNSGLYEDDNYAIAYGNGRYVSVSANSAVSSSSTDLVTWTRGTIPYSAFWFSVAFGNNTFVTVNRGSTNAPAGGAYSTDGITWLPTTMPVSQINWNSIQYGDDKFLAFSGYYSDSSVVAISTNGVTWTQGTMPVSSRWRVATYATQLELTPKTIATNLVPTQTGNSGKYLTTDGSTSFWDQAAKTYYQSASPSTPLLGDIWIDSDETYTDINPNDYALKSGTDFTGNVTVLSEDSVDTPGVRNIYHSTSEPSGGNNGDVWLVYY